MIDWRKTAEQNGISVEQFEKEMFTVACAMATMRIDRDGQEGECFKFSCGDQVGKIELYVRRVED